MSEAYGLDPLFERFVGVLCATQPRFWGAIGYALDIEALKHDEVKLVVRAARDIAKDTGHGPTAPALVIQRLRRWMDEGSVTLEQVHDVMDLIIETPDPPPQQAVIAELKPVITRRIQQETVRVAMDEYSKRGDFERVEKMLRTTKRVGVHDVSIGTKLGLSSFDEMERLRHLDRLPLGIPELDMALDGGVPRGTETVFVAGSGGGKSMMMSHVAANALKRGLFVVYATLELPEAELLARVKANLTGVPSSAIKNGEHAQAKRLIRKMIPTLGTFLVKSFPARATTVPDIRDWVNECEETEGYPVDVVVLDYGQKLKSHDKMDKDTYQGQGTVYEEFRLFMESTGKWGITGSQAKRRQGKEKGRLLDLDDIAESMKQVHVADTVISLNPDEDGEQITYNVGKNRYGRGNFSIGPLPHDWACGRMVIP